MAKHHQIDISPFENCMQDPQAILSKALHDGNIRDFKIALEMDADPTRIDETTNISLFEKALQTYGCSEFVEECIRRGCKCDYINRRLNKSAINFATDSKDPRILECIFKYNKNLPTLDTKYANLTPLNSLAKSITQENAEEIFSCMKVLLEHGANPNIPDQKEMTPILYVLNNRKLDNDKKKEIIQYFLDNFNIDLDTYRDGEARERLQSRYPDLQLPDETNITTNINFDTLLTLLRNNQEEKFLKYFNEYQLNGSTEKDNQQNMTQENNIALLMEAIKKGLNNAVDVLLKTDGINVNLKIQNSTPIEVACIYGNWKALQLLLDHDDLKLCKHENPLISVIKKLEESSYNNFSDYYNCFYTLLDSNKIDINEVDKSGSSALHYAVKYRNEKAIKELLRRGAYIGTKSVFNDLPIDDINPELLEDYFDSCVTTNGMKPGDDNFEIIINYMNLIPFSTTDSKSIKTSFHVNEEMLPIERIANSKDLRYLLKHPLITSFLFLKWHRLSMIFYVNFILYSLFCVSLVTYIVLHFNHDTANEEAIIVFKLFSSVGLLYMIIREILQFFISPLTFLRSKVNYLEITLIVLTIISLCEPNYEKETQRILAVCTILLASIELCLLVGSLPVLSISTHMLMLQEVSASFLKSFTLYSIFVITFSLCFYILFGKSMTTSSNAATTTTTTTDNDDTDKEGEFNKFVNPFTAIIKTIVMLTGEFDAGDIDFNSFYSYLVFLLFVFFMSIVLFNLLNGLAVSDTQAIKTQAELNGCICRTNLLSSYEKVLTGRDYKTNFIINHEPFRTLCKSLTNLFPNYINGNFIAILPNDNNKILIPITTKNVQKTTNSDDDIALIKTNNNKNPVNKMITVTNGFDESNEQQKKVLSAPVRILPCCCLCLCGRCSEMDVRTVKNALAIIEKNHCKIKERQRIQENEIRLKKIEEKIDKIFEILQEINLK